MGNVLSHLIQLLSDVGFVCSHLSPLWFVECCGILESPGVWKRPRLFTFLKSWWSSHLLNREKRLDYTLWLSTLSWNDAASMTVLACLAKGAIDCTTAQKILVMWQERSWKIFEDRHFAVLPGDHRLEVWKMLRPIGDIPESYQSTGLVIGWFLEPNWLLVTVGHWCMSCSALLSFLCGLSAAYQMQLSNIVFLVKWLEPKRDLVEERGVWRASGGFTFMCHQSNLS